MKEELLFFMNSFDRAKAKKDGVIIPNRGIPDICTFTKSMKVKGVLCM